MTNKTWQVPICLKKSTLRTAFKKRLHKKMWAADVNKFLAQNVQNTQQSTLRTVFKRKIMKKMWSGDVNKLLAQSVKNAQQSTLRIAFKNLH